MSIIQSISSDLEIGTPGPWRSEVIYGWGDTPNVIADDTKPFINFVRPKSYYTEFVEVENDDGTTSTVISEAHAREAGNYIATKEHKKSVELQQFADARRVARVPDLERIAIAADAFAKVFEEAEGFVGFIEVDAREALEKLREALA